MVDPRVVADLARGHPPGAQADDHRVQPAPSSAGPWRYRARRERAGPVPGHHWSRRGPPRSRWSWSWCRCGRCRGPRSSALPSHSPGARSTRPAGRAPEPPRGRAGSSPGPRSSRASPESICSNRPSRAPVSRNRRATSRPSTGLFLSSVALNRRQSFHQGLHRPLNTPDGHCLYVRLRRANGAKPDADQQQDLRTVAAVIIADVPPVAASSPSVHTVHPSPTP